MRVRDGHGRDDENWLICELKADCSLLDVLTAREENGQGDDEED